MNETTVHRKKKVYFDHYIANEQVPTACVYQCQEMYFQCIIMEKGRYNEIIWPFTVLSLKPCDDQATLKKIISEKENLNFIEV